MEKSFESQLKELEQIVGKLEDGDLPLEESPDLFEKGVRLSRECRERLTNAERRIEILLKDAEGNLSVRELDDAAISPADGESRSKKRIVFSEDEAPF
jgi:exodeoxyribonuclease VII small subunit